MGPIMLQDVIKRNTDYRDALRDILAIRMKQNPRYSLRAFARDLGLVPSRLSEIINKKQGLSRNAAEKVSKKLHLDNDLCELFCDSASALHSRSPSERRMAQIRLMKRHNESVEYHQLKIDVFNIISDWYHLGIIELMKVKDFREDPFWIAQQLKITPVQVELAIDRLIRMKLIERQDGKLVALAPSGQIEGEIPSESIRKFHRQILTKAGLALGSPHIEQREYSANIMAISRDELTEAKNHIRRFRERFSEQLNNEKPKDNLYCLSIQFFPLSEGGPSA
jgi:uncharacterized protein (TIGR02147 family)